MWVLIDNYDSFTYILHHYLLLTGNKCVVYKNDELSLSQLADINPTRLIISPGPETPLQAGICMAAIDHFHTRIPILGVCLGHQALGMYFGAKLVQAPRPMHGKTSMVAHYEHPLFNQVPLQFSAMRYHSLAIEALADTSLVATAHAQDDGVIMALAHTKFKCTGIQFHPESIGTEVGLTLLKNWAKIPQ
jgi:anthranilate synthase/aminodeoxychorismate synthase-like glutamine amidotransferase